MVAILNKYLNSQSGDIVGPIAEEDKIKLLKALLGSSFISDLDSWLGLAQDYLENREPATPFLRDNELRRKDKLYRSSFSKLDDSTKEIIFKLILSTTSGLLFSILVNFDQFRHGDLSISLKTKSPGQETINITPGIDDLHDELSEWIYEFSKYKDKLVERVEEANGTSFRLL